MLLFNEEEHRYFWKDYPDIKLISVSGLLALYHEKFDTLAVAEKTAVKRKVSVESLLEEWKTTNLEAVERGKHYHAFREEQYYKMKGVYRHPVVDGLKSSMDITQLEPGIYPELMLYLPEYNLVGTADYVKIYEDKTFELEDFKGFPLDTIIPTIDGFKEIQHLIVGDRVFDGDGKPTQVTNISQVHYNPCFKITFDTNETIVCDHEHKWAVEVNEVLQVLETEQIYEGFVNKKGLYRIRNSSVENAEKSLPIDPYVLGCWLGDGSASCGMLTNANDNIWNEIQTRGYVIGKDVSKGGSGKATTRTIMGIFPKLRELGLINNKHLPVSYMSASYNQRLDLLRGFMDTDGSFNKKRNRSVMITTKIWQAEAICNLVFSLGGKATLIPARTSGFGKLNIKTYHVCFRLPTSPFLSKNQEYTEHMKNVKVHKSSHRYIKLIEKVATVPTICISVDSPLHTYMVTKNYIPTHNTNKELKFSGFMVFDPNTKTKKEKKMYAPIQSLPDCNGVHYMLQLSLYAYMLEKAGYKLREGGLTIHHILFADGKACESIPYPVNYLRDKVIALLKHYKANAKSTHS